MGLLDEAIRQHLELKRQHGASDEELQMQEQEALGPVRRDPVEHAAATPGDDAEPAAEGRVDDADEALLGVSAEDLYDPIGTHEEAAPEEADAVAEEEGFGVAPTGDTPTRGFEAVQEPVHAGDEIEAAEEGEDEDVLEETPDFLQETPEHDRLWFEQRPPRDFDFDE